MYFLDVMHFSFSKEMFWVALSIPATIYVLVSIVISAIESAEAKKRKRDIKLCIEIMFYVGVLIGFVEVLAFMYALFFFAVSSELGYLGLAFLLVIPAVAVILRFIFEAVNAKYEERSIQPSILVLFIVSLVFFAHLIFVIARNS